MRRRQLKPLPHPTAVSVVSEPGPTSLPKVAPVQSISRTVEPAALDSATEMPAVAKLLADYFRCPGVAEFEVTDDRSQPPGYFRFGPNAICFGRCSSGVPSNSASASLHDASEHVASGGSSVRLSFDPAEVIDNLRCERYVANSSSAGRPRPANQALQSVYYMLRPLMGVAVRKHFQRLCHFRLRNKADFPEWPGGSNRRQHFRASLGSLDASARSQPTSFYLVLAGGSAQLHHSHARRGNGRGRGLWREFVGAERLFRNQVQLPVGAGGSL